VRVMMLAPFLILLSAAFRTRRADGKHAAKLAIPWFAFVFIAVTCFNSLGWLQSSTLHHIGDADTLLLSMAMAGLGLSTHIGAVRSAGLRPLLLAALLFVWLICGGAAINRAIATLFA